MPLSSKGQVYCEPIHLFGYENSIHVCTGIGTEYCWCAILSCSSL